MRLSPYRGSEEPEEYSPLEDALFEARTSEDVRKIIGTPKARTASIQPLEFGDKPGHTFHGNQHTGGIGGGDKEGLDGQNQLRVSMLTGLSKSAEKLRDPKWALEDVVVKNMREGAKAEIVKAAGKDIADAARNDPAVKAEYMKWAMDGIDAADAEQFKTDPAFRDRYYPDANEEAYGEMRAQSYVDSWAASAAGNMPESLALQQTTADVLDAQSASFDKYLQSNDVSPGARVALDGILGKGETLAAQPATMKAFVQGEYDRTQAFLKENGIKSVTLYRGMTFGPHDPPSPFKSNGDQPIQMNPASSWSVDRKTAALGFAGEGYGNNPDAVKGYLLTTTVPAEDIISTARTGRGALVEGEVLIRNQPDSHADVQQVQQ